MIRLFEVFVSFSFFDMSIIYFRTWVDNCKQLEQDFYNNLSKKDFCNVFGLDEENRNHVDSNINWRLRAELEVTSLSDVIQNVFWLSWYIYIFKNLTLREKLDLMSLFFLITSLFSWLLGILKLHWISKSLWKKKIFWFGVENFRSLGYINNHF